MATVPGDPDAPSNVTPMLPKQFQPTMADFLQAAAIMDQKGKFAMDTSGMRKSTNVEDVRGRPFDPILTDKAGEVLKAPREMWEQYQPTPRGYEGPGDLPLPSRKRT